MDILMKTGKLTLMLAVLLVFSACSPIVYKKEVKAFSQGVKDATIAFETLRQESKTKDQQALEKKLAKNLVVIDVSDTCSTLVEELQKRASCLGRWAKYRAGYGAKPDTDKCEEQTGFYQFPITRARKCQVGSVNAQGRIDPSRFKADLPLKQTAVIARKLSDYASALSEIVDSKDIEELQSALGDAKMAISGVASRYKDQTGQELPGAQTIGPITELVGAAATATLERRRFNAMKAIVNKADPVVTAAGERLSINTMPLVLKTRIRPAQVRLVEAAEEFNPAFLTKENYPSKLKAIREAYTAYMQQFESDPSIMFEAMAKAHTALKDALNNPKTQYETMQAAIKDFSEKAKAVHDVLSKSSNH